MGHQGQIRTMLVLVAGFVLTPTACNKENNIDASTTINNYVTQVIGPKGGHIEGPDGVILDVPAGVLTEETALTLGEPPSSEYPALPAGLQADSAVFTFEPHQQTFAGDVFISIPVMSPPGQGWRLYRADPGGVWQPVSISSTSAGYLHASATHFSFYFAALGGDQDASIDQEACGPSNCQGCCDSTGQCASGQYPVNCGSGGNDCLPCSAPNVCVPLDGGLGGVCQSGGAGGAGGQEAGAGGASGAGGTAGSSGSSGSSGGSGSPGFYLYSDKFADGIGIGPIPAIAPRQAPYEGTCSPSQIHLFGSCFP